MKTKRLLTITTAVAVAGLLLLPLRGDAAKPARTDIDTLDTMYYNGETLDFTYTVDSRCDAPAHETYVELNVEKVPTGTKKSVTAVSIAIYDEAPESSCDPKYKSVTISSKVNLTKAIDKEMDSWKGKGYKISSDLAVVLPPVRRPVKGGFADSAHPGMTGPQQGQPGQMPGQGGPGMPDGGGHHYQDQVKVRYIDYSYNWSCILNKNDGSRKDGFTGTGATIDEARQGAINGCRGTNNPYCNDYAMDPAHTKCDVKLIENPRDEMVAFGAVPQNAKVTWSCKLNKNDGSRSDGFTAEGDTENAARAAASNLCKSTNNPYCDQYSLDDDHTTCEQSAVVEGPKPALRWNCTLYKNDGSRKDGFAGSGQTEYDARMATLPGCQKTNNPYCRDYALDPKHTSCTPEFVK